jgi:hypothetical protein
VKEPLIEVAAPVLRELSVGVQLSILSQGYLVERVRSSSRRPRRYQWIRRISLSVFLECSCQSASSHSPPIFGRRDILGRVRYRGVTAIHHVIIATHAAFSQTDTRFLAGDRILFPIEVHCELIFANPATIN